MSQTPTESPRLYVGRLTPDVRTADIEDLFQPFGRIVDVRLMGTFGFVELDSPRDAEAAIKALHGQDLNGARLIVESAKPNPRSNRDRGERPDRGPRADRGPGPDSYGPPARRDPRDEPWGPPPRRERAPLRRAQFRVLLSHLPPGLSWQAIKDLGRPHGTVVFADVDPTRADEGIIEYNFRDEMEAAVRALEGFDYRGSRLRADPAEAPPPPAFEREREERLRPARGPERGYDRPPPRHIDRRDRRDDRYRPRSPRREPRDYRADDRREDRERSPRGEDRDDRRSRSRSPVPRRGERQYDEDRLRDDDRRYDEDRVRDDASREEEQYERSPAPLEGGPQTPPAHTEVEEAAMEDA